ncbi:hypothetical protein CQW23_25543 [Capsicum baccatum]|uniref:Zinc finger, CCHC-type n=1 Tax=Capsicum baccatum TaxID=33114 RepID=A0A2G2VLA3_CAPBA|nr:hypothetical protein CQW23_25543 [Capsicum baccatum]
MYFGLAIVLMVVGYSIFLVSVDAAKGDQWRSLAVMLQTVLGSVFGYVLVANMVLYMYCKDLNNDENLAFQTGGEYLLLRSKSCGRNYILSGLQDDLYNVYSGTMTAKELWGALERKYKTEDAKTKKFFVARFLEYKMIDNKSGLIVNEVFQVAAIIKKLPPIWKDFKNYLKHKRKEMSVEDLIVQLCIEEDNKAAERSQATIGRAGSMMYNGKSCHIIRRHNAVRELLSSEIITVDYVKSKDNVSGLLTKGLSREGVERTSKGMGLRPRTSQHVGNSQTKDPKS